MRVRTAILIATALCWAADHALGQVTTHDPGAPAVGIVIFRAPDGSSSRIEKGGVPGKAGSVSFVPKAGGFRSTFVIDDAGGCLSFPAIEHKLRGDTITIAVSHNAPEVCPAISTPVPYTVMLTGVPPERYWLRVHLNDWGVGGDQDFGNLPLLMRQARLE